MLSPESKFIWKVASTQLERLVIRGYGFTVSDDFKTAFKDRSAAVLKVTIRE